MKILALYLPQFHRTPENDEWWGAGYTEWTAVKNAKPMYRGHQQPKIPLDDNYYDLSDETGAVWQWQADLANRYGIYGFCIYHYWLGNGKQLLQKPMEILLNHPEIDINYCVCWANHDWTRAWYGVPEDILCKQEYGDEVEWRKHFDYLSNFFEDDRYIKMNNRPVVCIYDSKKIASLGMMKKKWDMWAQEIGFDGVYFIAANTASGVDMEHYDCLDAYYNFEAGYTYYQKVPFSYRWIDFQVRKVRMFWAKIRKKETCGYRVNAKRVYRYMQKNKLYIKDKKIYQGIFSNWDNTPRRGSLGMVYEGCSPSIFEKMLCTMNERLEPDDYLFLNAWNEWGEGCYIEPDNRYGYAYLDSINTVMNASK